ncbi:MAG: amidinotransferase [Chloroflexi bacterium]|nr:amidinotransferase [Chloroflexota bacterium]
MTNNDLFNAAAYGGAGWSPRTAGLNEEIGSIWGKCGISTEWSRLKAVLLHRPDKELATSDNPNEMQMLAPIDIGKAQAQHDAMADAYRNAGVKVHYVEPEGEASPNQIFVADLVFMTPEGAILARPASTVRAGEERWVARRLAELGIPIIRSVRGKGTFEGADAMWINPKTVIIGRGLRTNDEGVAQVSSTLNEMGVEVVQVDLPVGTMHLMGVLRIISSDLAIARGYRFAHRGVDALKARGMRVLYLPDEKNSASYTAALNFVTLAPYKILMVGGNPVAQDFYENLGITCHAVEMDELRKAAGAIGCTSGILEREKI